MTVDAPPGTRVESDRVAIRPLTAADSDAYRQLRRHVLEIGEGKYFSTSYTQEQQFTSDAQWRAHCTATQVSCTIGSFVDGELVGIMRVQPYGDPRNGTAEWSSTWIAPRYRTAGIGRQAYEQTHAWCHAHGYRYSIIDIRADNARSRAIRERQGAVYLFTERDVVWADGSTADAHYFMLSLVPGTERVRSTGQALGLLRAAQAFLRDRQAAEAAQP
jgi:RimJ/RimL family protein N-acetyltransferase